MKNNQATVRSFNTKEPLEAPRLEQLCLPLFGNHLEQLNQRVEPFEVVERMSKFYSGDTLVNDKVRGIITYEGKKWVCISIHSFGKAAKSLTLQRIMHGESMVDAESNLTPCCIYTNRQIKHRQQRWVFLNELLTVATFEWMERENNRQHACCRRSSAPENQDGIYDIHRQLL
jgi:hypothetical protein